MPRIRRIIDCSQPLFHNAPRYVGNPPFEYSPTYRFLEQDRSNEEFIKMTTHSGTHIDVPHHMVDGGRRIGDFPIETFMGGAIILDASKMDGRLISSDRLKPRYEAEIHEGDIVVVYTGWSEKRGFNRQYLKEFPALTSECAKWLVNKKIKGIGIDTLGFESYPPPPDLPVHTILLSGGLWLLEEMYLPKQVLERERWWLMALPWKIEDAGGSPTRAILIEFEG